MDLGLVVFHGRFWGIGTFEALETLALGIQGKLALRQVLSIVRELDARVPELARF
jgi:hypothetical protein